jgi:hypothetical protein
MRNEVDQWLFVIMKYEGLINWINDCYEDFKIGLMIIMKVN